MQATRIASLLVAFYLLTSAATAYAECAWVLWSSVYVMKEGKVADQFYSADEAFTSKADCDRAAIYYKQNYKDQARKAFFTCLPDTVDPRGRGK